MKKIGFTNFSCLLVIAEDIVVTGAVLLLCHQAIAQGFLGTLAYLTALIALQQAKSTVVITAIVSKSKAENIKGGIKYEMTVNKKQDCD